LANWRIRGSIVQLEEQEKGYRVAGEKDIAVQGLEIHSKKNTA
jgi:hypothetical protein